MQNALGQTMTYAYDDVGRLAAEQDALGHETDYQYDANGNLLVQTTTRTIPGGRRPAGSADSHHPVPIRRARPSDQFHLP